MSEWWEPVQAKGIARADAQCQVHSTCLRTSKEKKLKLKLQYFSHLMQRTDSLEKALMLGKTEVSNILLYIYTTTSLSIHLLRHNQIVSN